MDRKPEHLSEDPFLRAEYVGQESLDEFLARKAPLLLEPDWEVTAEERGLVPENVYPFYLEQWRQTLSLDTNMTEEAYLRGFTDKTARLAFLDQEHKALRDAVVKLSIFREQN